MNSGRVVQVIGPVIDVEFAREELPPIYNAVHIEGETAGIKLNLTAEVMQHLGNNVARCVAMSRAVSRMMWAWKRRRFHAACRAS